MTSDDGLSLILRRLDEIERKLDRMTEELRPTAIGYSVRRQSPKEGLKPVLSASPDPHYSQVPGHMPYMH